MTPSRSQSLPPVICSLLSLDHAYRAIDVDTIALLLDDDRGCQSAALELLAADQQFGGDRHRHPLVPLTATVCALDSLSGSTTRSAWSSHGTGCRSCLR
jgi:hypothetical protein